jgi:hypothetical protein
MFTNFTGKWEVVPLKGKHPAVIKWMVKATIQQLCGRRKWIYQLLAMN